MTINQSINQSKTDHNQNDCIFCKIVRGDLPSYKIYEDNKYLAFLDIFPYVEGHVLVIPKEHYRWVWDVPEYGEYMTVVKKLATHFQKRTTSERVYSFAFGTMVPHAHVHILPDVNHQDMHRLEDKIDKARRPQFSETEAEQMVNLLKLDIKLF